VSRDVVFYETESKSAEEIESFLQKLETKGNQRKKKIKVNQIHIIGMNLIFLHLKMIHPIHLLQQHHLGLPAVHQTLLVATVHLTMILYLQNLQLIDEH
jgi:hypothetical protein